MAINACQTTSQQFTRGPRRSSNPPVTDCTKTGSLLEACERSHPVRGPRRSSNPAVVDQAINGSMLARRRSHGLQTLSLPRSSALDVSPTPSTTPSPRPLDPVSPPPGSARPSPLKTLRHRKTTPSFTPDPDSPKIQPPPLFIERASNSLKTAPPALFESDGQEDRASDSVKTPPLAPPLLFQSESDGQENGSERVAAERARRESRSNFGTVNSAQSDRASTVSTAESSSMYNSHAQASEADAVESIEPHSPGWTKKPSMRRGSTGTLMAGNAGVAIRKARSHTARLSEQQPAERLVARSLGRSATEKASRSASVAMQASSANLNPLPPERRPGPQPEPQMRMTEPTTSSDKVGHEHAEHGRRKSASDLDAEFSVLLSVGSPSDTIAVETVFSEKQKKEEYAVTVERTQALLMAADEEEGEDCGEDEGNVETAFESAASPVDDATTSSRVKTSYANSLMFAAARISAKLQRMRRHSARLEYTGDLQEDIEAMHALAQ